MPVEYVAITAVTVNPDNPRLIKDDRFQRLVASVKAFPQMLELRPVVINDHGVILGGNMRYHACVAAGMTRIPVARASALTPEQQREFIIKDNVGSGEWEWDRLANEWDLPTLAEWGLGEVTMFAQASDAAERDIDLPRLSESAEAYLTNSIRQIVLHYDKDTHADVLKRFAAVAKARDIESDNAAVVLALLEHWEQSRA